MKVDVSRFLFHPFHHEHSLPVRLLSVITNIALTILTGGLYLGYFAYVRYTEESTDFRDKIFYSDPNSIQLSARPFNPNMYPLGFNSGSNFQPDYLPQSQNTTALENGHYGSNPQSHSDMQVAEQMLLLNSFYVPDRNVERPSSAPQATTPALVQGGGIISPSQNNALNGLVLNADVAATDSNYLYQATDISPILVSGEYRMGLGGVKVYEPMDYAQLSNNIHSILRGVNAGRPAVCIYNINNAHWVTFALFRSQNKITVFYKDSMGGIDPHLQQLLLNTSTQIEFIRHPGSEQSGDGSHCGVMALDNAKKMAGVLSSGGDLVGRLNALNFCTLGEAYHLRKNVYPRLYNDGLSTIKNAEMTNQNQLKYIRGALGSEVEKFASTLAVYTPNYCVLPLVGDQVVSKKELQQMTSTIVVSLAIDSTSPLSYHFNVQGSPDLKGQLQTIISQFNDFYEVDGEIIKIYQPLT